MQLIGVDVGGTFTDIVYYDSETEQTLIHKVPTTPDDPSIGVMGGVIELCRRHSLARERIAHFFHGTTIATNAALTHDGARTGMVTTRGYRDILHIGRHQRPQHYSIRQEIPWQDRPLVKRRHRKVVSERIAPPRGEVVTPLAEDEVRQAARALKKEGVDSIAVCFLFSYLDASHERRARAIIAEECPDAYICTSAAVSPQFREFERFTTTAMNAFVGPKVRDYVSRLSAALGEAGMSSKLHIMLSNGGVGTAAMVAERPVTTLLSGPAAGVLGGAWSGESLGRDHLITFDVGGTSADIGLITGGRFSEATARDTWIAGYPILVPMIDITTIGAGGGSIAHVDRGGSFRVGPQSAGARPGPAAYGQGGTEPTVTDANLVLGRLDPDNFLGGEMQLDAAAAEAAIDGLAREVGLARAATADGVLAIVNANMANAIRSRTVQKGIDPRLYALVAFGGAGPLHAVDVAAILEIPEIVVPLYPGANSAVGLLTSDLKYDAVRTEFQVSSDLDLARMNADLAAMEAGLRERFAADGVDAAAVAFERYGDLRYVGQGYEIRVPMPAGELDDAGIGGVFGAFHETHKAEYGHFFPGGAIEIVNLRLVGAAPTPKIARPGATKLAREESLVRTGPCYFSVDGTLDALDTAFHRRDALGLDETLAGPAVVLQKDATTVVPPGWTARVDVAQNLVIRKGGWR